MPPPAQLYIHTLGRFRVMRDGEPIPEAAWGTHRARTLFKILLTRAGRPMPGEQLTDLIWPDAAPKAAARNLYTCVSELRRALEPELKKPADSTFILSTEAGYQFNPDSPHALDKVMLEHYLGLARQHFQQRAYEASVQAFAQAEALYVGDYLPEDLYADWSTAERERLRGLFQMALLETAEAMAQLGHYRQAIAHGRRLLALDNCREDVYRALMLYHYAAGDRAQALRTYTECQAVLERELAIDPSPATRKLAEQISAQQVTEVDQRQRYPAPQPIRLPDLKAMPFVGRHLEMARLRGWRQLAEAGQGHLIFVVGDMGVGKSRLAASSLGAPVLRAQSHELTQSLAYQPLIEILRQAAHIRGWPTPMPNWLTALAGLIPDLPLTGRSPIPSEKRQLLEAFWAGLLDLCQAQPGLALVLEDLHWADDDTLEFLAFITQRLPAQPLLLVATCRDDKRLKPLLARAGREAGVQALPLSAITETEVVQLIESMTAETPLTTQLGQRLYRATGGNPLFIAHVIAVLFESGRLWRDEHGGWRGLSALTQAPVLSVPDEVQELLAHRTEALSPPALRLLNLAAVWEAEFSGADLTAALAQLGEAEFTEAVWLDALDELLGANLLVATATNFYFQHPAIREALYARLSPVRRQRLHLAVAQVLEARTPNDLARLAHHFGRSADSERAVHYLLTAADAARQIYAHSTALALYEQALAVMAPGDSAAAITRWPTEWVRAEIGRASLAYRLDLPDVREAAIAQLQQLAPHLNEGPAQVEALLSLSTLFGDAGRSEDAITLLTWLLTELTGPSPQTQRERAWRILGEAHSHLGQLAEAASAFEQAYQEALALQDEAARATNLIYAGFTYSHLTRWEAAVANLRAAEALAAHTNDLYLQARVANGSLVIWNDLGCWADYEASLSRLERLMAQTEADRVRPLLAARRGFLFLRRDQHNEARQQFEHALALARARNNRSVEGLAQLGLGLAAAAQHDPLTQRTALLESVALYRQLHDVLNLAQASAHCALALVAAGQLNEAATLLQRPDAEPRPVNKHTALYQLAQARLQFAQNEPLLAAATLSGAVSLVQAQAQRLSDLNIRASFLQHPHSQLVLKAVLGG